MDFWDSGLLLYVHDGLSRLGESLICIGFITFTTTGYGDYSPKTAAGRSVFLFWALLGLATMTILVSGKFDLSSGNGFRLLMLWI